MHPGVHAATDPDKAAYIMAGTGHVVTYRELDDEANRFLGELLVSGILTPVHLAQVAENQRLVRRALMNLARRERAIVQWWMDGLTLEEIAMRLGRSHSSVRRVWRAARDRLHAPLQVCS